MHVDAQRGVLFVRRSELASLLGSDRWCQNFVGAELTSNGEDSATDDDSEQEIDWKDIPVGIWNKIFDSLGSERIANILYQLSHVSNAARAVVHRYLQQQRSFDFRLQSNISLSFSVLLAQSDIIELPNLRYLDVSGTEIHPRELLAILRKCSSNIDELHVADCNSLFYDSWQWEHKDEQWFEFLICCPRLRVLDMHVGDMYTREWSNASYEKINKWRLVNGPGNSDNHAGYLLVCGMMGSVFPTLVCLESLEDLNISGNFFLARLITDPNNISWIYLFVGNGWRYARTDGKFDQDGEFLRGFT
jgi:hypothetical protein